MITWDGVLASQQRRVEREALHLPKLPVSVGSLSPLPTVAGSAAGTPTDRGTGSHHKQQEES